MNAKAAANYLIYIMGETFSDLTNMKINKLLYFAQGYYLKRYGKPLFDDVIEAWDHGPVIPDVYAAYKRYGDGPVKVYDEALLSEIMPEAEEILFGVARKYGKYTASALRNMTHTIGSPWDKVYKSNLPHTVIPVSFIRDYFSEMEDLTTKEKIFKEEDFIGYRDENGILVLPKEWDDEKI